LSTNRGADLLRKSGATADAIGKAAGASETAAIYWRSGKNKPKLDARERLAEAYGVPVEAWDEPSATASNPVAKHDTATQADEPPTLELVEADIPEGAAGKARLLDAEVRSLMARMRRDRSALPLEQAKVLSLLASTLEKLARLNGELELTNLRIVHLPFWRRICETAAHTLSPWPQAARAYVEMVRGLEHEASASMTATSPNPKTAA